VHTGFWWENLRAKDRLEHLDTDRKIILKRVFNVSLPCSEAPL
jgi:hypothetical protein